MKTAGDALHSVHCDAIGLSAEDAFGCSLPAEASCRLMEGGLPRASVWTALSRIENMVFGGGASARRGDAL
ncbi:MAG: hypothetical protein ACPGXK_17260, partial [Phycisphaerae bacterium]